jgi:hypothetical protein
MRKFLATLAILGALLLSVAGIAFAADPHSGDSTGPPSQSCGSSTAQNTPGGGNSTNSPGSPFQGGVADSHYNVAKSQYDVACFQNSQPGHP